MTELLLRIFVKDYKNVSDPVVKRKYGTFSSIFGVIVNLILFTAKFIIGTFVSSVSIRADGINNLSDAGNSIISLISFKISGRPADREHPFGHARMEYIASLIVSFIILHISLDIFSESIGKIFNPTEPTFHYAAVAVLLISILLKLWLFIFTRYLGKKINSVILQASAADSISDVIATSAVLLSSIISHITNFNTDGYMGIIAGILVMIQGLKILNEAKNLLLGTQPDPELVNKIISTATAHEEILGVHDIVIHNYGEGQCFASLHVEVDGERNIFESHDVTDNIEREIAEKYGVHCALHMDPIVTGDEKTAELREKTEMLAAVIGSNIRIHDFRLVIGPTHNNLIFDAEVPFETKMSDEEIRQKFKTAISAIDKNYYAVIKIDRV